MKFDVKKFVDGLHDYFAAELSPLLARVKMLEMRKPEKGEPGAPGKDGISCKDGFPGRDGKDGAPGEKGIPGISGKDGLPGRDGKPGEPGKDGIPGKDGVSGRDGKPGEPGKDGISGKDGVSGRDGKPGEPGKDGISGKDGIPGRDGKDVTEEDIEAAVERRAAAWELDFERRASEVMQRAMSKIVQPKDGVDGKDGSDGKDGLGFDDLSIVQLDAKRLKFIFIAGDQKKEFVLKMPIVVDEGVYVNGKDYAKGDGVTYGGSFWIAQVDHPNQSPGKGNEWRLAVKKGRDAKDGRTQ